MKSKCEWGNPTKTHGCLLVPKNKAQSLSIYMHALTLQDPDGFGAALVALDPQPVRVDADRDEPSKEDAEDTLSNKGKKRTKSKKRSKSPKEEKPKPKKPRSSAASSHGPKAEVEVIDKTEVVKTFGESYQHIIRALPVKLWPSNPKHGNHSYTVCFGLVKHHVTMFDLCLAL